MSATRPEPGRGYALVATDSLIEPNLGMRTMYLAVQGVDEQSAVAGVGEVSDQGWRAHAPGLARTALARSSLVAMRAASQTISGPGPLLDLGGGLAWSDAARGLAAEFHARGLLTHDSEGFRERGLSGAFSWAPGRGSGWGPSLTLTQSMGGPATGGVDALLAHRHLGDLATNDTGSEFWTGDGGNGSANRRLELRMGYGFTVLAHRFPTARTHGSCDYALLLFLYHTGARSSEAARAKVAEPAPDLRSVRLDGKRRKVRTCVLSSRTAEALRELLGARIDGLRVPRSSTMSSAIRWPAAASMDSSCAPRIRPPKPFRLCATSGSARIPCAMPRSSTSFVPGVDINTIRAWLGHVALETTSRYAEVDEEIVAKSLQMCADEGMEAMCDGSPSWHADGGLMTFLASL